MDIEHNLFQRWGEEENNDEPSGRLKVC
jgi:hypothetical protein